MNFKTYFLRFKGVWISPSVIYQILISNALHEEKTRNNGGYSV